MPEMTNEVRAERARLPLQLFAATVYGGDEDRDITLPESFEQAVGDLLGNLHHFAQQQFQGERSQEWFDWLFTTGEDIGQMMERLLARGRGYYEEELVEGLMAPVDDRCGECGHYYPKPIELHHSDEECLDSQRGGGDAPDCARCGASNAGARTKPFLCEPCSPPGKCAACEGTGLNDDSHAGVVCETCSGSGVSRD